MAFCESPQMNHRSTPKPASILGATLVSLLSAAEPAQAQADPADPPVAPPATEAPSAPEPAAEPPPPAPAPQAPAPVEPAPTPPEEGPPPEAATEPAAEARASAGASLEIDPPRPVAAPPPAEASAKAAPPEATAATAPLTLSVGEGERALSVTFYGFVQADYIYDTTRSFDEWIGPHLVERTDTYDGTVGRTQFSTRNTRFGLFFTAPSIGGVRPTAVLEGDFFGNQPASAHEGSFYDSPTFRLRHAFVSVKTDYIDVVLGQTYDVFGWQNTFFPASAELLPLPAQVFSRRPQFRLSRSFGADGPVGVTIAAAAARPAQRDAEIPDVNGGLLFTLNDWKGITTPGNIGTRATPLSLGISGVVRQFKVDAFTPPPTQTSNEALGWGLSVDALLPVIPADDASDRGNRLTLLGSVVTGTGVGDLMNTLGGASFPTLPNPAQATPPPEYHGNIDPGLLSFDTQGVLHSIDWQGFRVGAQYYLPPSGRFIIAANYTQAHSRNLDELFPQGGAEIELLVRVADRTRYADVSLFWDAMPFLRFGLGGSYTWVEYLDGDDPHNLRAKAQAVYLF